MKEKPTYEELEKKIRRLEKKASRLKRVESELKETLHFNESLLLAIPMPVFFKDAEGRYQGCNKAYTDLVGLTTEQIKGKTVQELWPGELSEEYHRKDIEVMHHRRHQVYEFEVKDKNGVMRPVIFNKDVFYDEHGEVAGLVGTFQDITERKKNEEALRKSESFLNKVLSASLSGLYIYDLEEGRNVFINPQYTELTGLTMDDLRSFSATEFFERFHPDDRPGVAKHLERMMASPNGKVVEIEYRFLTADDLWITCFSRDSVFCRRSDGSVKQIIGAFLDISEIKLSERMLLEWNQNLEELVSERTALAEERTEQLRRLTMELCQAEERERGRLACVLHDDLQQILAAAKLNLTALKRPVETSEEKEKKLARISEMLDEGIRKTRFLSHELSPMTISRNNLFSALKILSNDMMEKKLLTATVEAEEGAEPGSPVISSLLFRAAKELLFNVVKHSGVDIAHVSLKNRGERIVMTVEDSGGGCDIAAQGRLEDNECGLGLFSIEERINMLGGRMEIESSPKKGFRVTLTVPMDVP